MSKSYFIQSHWCSQGALRAIAVKNPRLAEHQKAKTKSRNGNEMTFVGKH